MNKWLKMDPPLPVAWYDNQAEHLWLAFSMMLINTLDKSEPSPIDDILFYELARSEVQPAWPAPVKMLAQYFRGLAFFQHYFTTLPKKN